MRLAISVVQLANGTWTRVLGCLGNYRSVEMAIDDRLHSGDAFSEEFPVRLPRSISRRIVDEAAFSSERMIAECIVRRVGHSRQLPPHTRDEDCHVVDGVCVVCGVTHVEQCARCGGRGYHRPSCSECCASDRDPDDDAALVERHRAECGEAELVPFNGYAMCSRCGIIPELFEDEDDLDGDEED